jgi:superfamily II DNA or RNA helicase
VLDQLQLVDEPVALEASTGNAKKARRSATRRTESSAAATGKKSLATDSVDAAALVQAAMAFERGTDADFDTWSETEFADCLQTHQNFSDVELTRPAVSHWRLVFCSVEMSLLFGDTEAAQLQRMDTWLSAVESKEVLADATALRASVAFVKRLPEQVITLYQSARDASGDDAVIPRGLSAAHYALALIQSNAAKATDKAGMAKQMASLVTPLNTLADQYQSQHRRDPVVPVLRVLTDFARVASGQRAIDETIWLGGLHIDASPWLDLFINLCRYWLDAPADEQLVERLARHVDRASEAGVHWYVDEALTLLSAMGLQRDSSEFQPQVRSPGWLITVYQRADDWQASLDVLSQTVNRFVRLNDPGDGTQQKRRLTWWLQANGSRLRIEPREQRQGQDGRWSRGRRFPLKLLLEECGTLDFLSQHDLKICADLRNQLQINHALAFEKTVDIRQVSSLRQILAHPSLFRLDESEPAAAPTSLPTARVRSRECHPALHIVHDSAQGSIHISMRPYPSDELNTADAFYCYWDDAGTLAINRFTEGQLDMARALTYKGLTVPEAGCDAVLDSLRAMASLIEVHSDIVVDNGNSVEPDNSVYFHLHPLKQGLELDLFHYPLGVDGPSVKPGCGKPGVHALINDVVLNTTRCFSDETVAAAEVAESAGLAQSIATWHWSLTEPEQSLEVLSALQEMTPRVKLLWPAGEKINLSRRFECSDMQLQIHASSNGSGIDITGELKLDGQDGQPRYAADISTGSFGSETIDLRKLLASIQDADGRFVTLDDGKILQLSQRLRQQLDALNAICTDGVAHPLSVAVLEQATHGMALQDDDGWHEQLEKLQEAQSLEPVPPRELKASLRDYQLHGFQWMARLAHWGAGACLADDMGLGKTMQSLSLILSRAAGGPTLVVAPTSVCGNWLAEAERFAPTLRLRWLGGSNRVRMLRDAKPGDLFVCSYGVLQNDIDTLQSIHWQTIIADEAQSFKNAGTRRSQAMMSLSASFRVIATGTPIENHLGELWNLFRFINPGLMGSSQQFKQRYAVPIEQHQDEQARERLKNLIRPFILRRLKREVLTELPERTEITHLVELSTDERAFYDQLREQALHRISEYAELDSEQRFRVLAEITTLRQASCHPALVTDDPPCDSAKMRAFSKIVDELRFNGHRCLVFSQFVGHLSLIRKHLDSKSISYQYLDGSTSVKKRKQAVDDFQAGEGELFLISLKAGGSGLNLTAADYVIHMDPWWNPAVEDQASDRAYRMGQKRPVTIYRMVVKDSIEEKIVKLHEQKRDLANALLEGTDAGSVLSVDELVELIQDEEADRQEGDAES